MNSLCKAAERSSWESAYWKTVTPLRVTGIYLSTAVGEMILNEDAKRGGVKEKGKRKDKGGIEIKRVK
jgi:hypothetical protein